jgi:hypothetical protein
MSPITITRYVPSVAAGSYPARVTGCETRAAKDGSGEFRVWEFTLDDGTGRTVGATSSMQTSPKSKAGRWIAAMLGRTPDVEEDVEVIGLPVTIGVILNDDGFERVDQVLGRVAATPRRPTTPVEAPSALETEEVAAEPLPF